MHPVLDDYHVHTNYSDDSDYPMEQVVLDAIAMDMKELCFTDHVDYGIKRDWDDPRGILRRNNDPNNVLLANVDYPKYVSEIKKLQERYGDKITLRLGLEFGIQMHTIPDFEKVFHSYPFDFILLSVHQVEDLEFWTQEFQAGRTQEEYNLRYYEELLNLVKHYKNYSVLAHLDLISRYDKMGIYPFEKLRPVITEILKTVIADGKGIEINSSHVRYHLPDLTPCREILTLYRDLGGRILTFGSDSHKPEHLGAHIQETKEEVRALGFREYCTFSNMQPVFHEL